MKKTYLEELKDYLRIKSVSTLPEYKGEIEKAWRFVKEKLEKEGFKVKIWHKKGANPVLLAHLKGGKRTILIYNHYDVQPAFLQEGWKADPFEPRLEGGKLIARGVADNKANFLFRLQAIRELKKEKGRLPVSIKWVIEGEEEIGSPNLDRLTKEYSGFFKDCELCFWETGGVNHKGEPVVVLGQKGILYVELCVEHGTRDLHSGFASMVDSAVWRLVHALSTLRDRKGNVLIEGFNELVVFPDATEWKLIEEEGFNPQGVLKNLGKKEFLGSEKDKKKILFRHYFGGTCNIAGLWAGFTVPGRIKTIIPYKACCKIDFRLVNAQTPERVLRLLKEHLKKKGFEDVKVKKLVSLPASKTSPSHPLVERFLDIVKQEYGKIEVKITSGGSGPRYYLLDRFGIPGVTFGANHTGSKSHGPEENIRVRDYFKALKVFKKLLTELAK